MVLLVRFVRWYPIWKSTLAHIVACTWVIQMLAFVYLQYRLLVTANGSIAVIKLRCELISIDKVFKIALLSVLPDAIASNAWIAQLRKCIFLIWRAKNDWELQFEQYVFFCYLECEIHQLQRIWNELYTSKAPVLVFHLIYFYSSINSYKSVKSRFV